MALRIPLDTVCEKKIETVSSQYDGKIEYIDISSIDNFEKTISNTQIINSKDAPSRARQLVKNGDILVSTVRPNLNAVAVVKKESDYVLVASTGYCVLRCNSEIDSHYVFHFCQSPYFIDDMVRQATGASYPAVSNSIVRSCLIPLRSLEEQQHIATVLDKLSNLISLRKQQLAKLDELVKARFVEMFGEYDISETQDGWKMISEIGTVGGGATPKTDIEGYWDGEYRWITPAEIENDSGYIYDSVRKITESGIKSCSLQEFPKGTVILSSRAPIGKLAIAGESFYCNQGFKNIICGDKVLPWYAYHILLFNTDYLNALGRGATFKEISKSIVEKIKIPVPAFNQQKIFSNFVERIYQQKLTIRKSLDKLEVLKKSLMQEYFG